MARKCSFFTDRSNLRLVVSFSQFVGSFIVRSLYLQLPNFDFVPQTLCISRSCPFHFLAPVEIVGFDVIPVLDLLLSCFIWAKCYIFLNQVAPLVPSQHCYLIIIISTYSLA